MPTPLTLRLTRGDDEAFGFRMWTDSDRTERLDITGRTYRAWFAEDDTADAEHIAATCTVENVDPDTGDTDPAGVLWIKLTETDTTAIGWSRGVWACKEEVGGVETTILRGPYTVARELVP